MGAAPGWVRAGTGAAVVVAGVVPVAVRARVRHSHNPRFVLAVGRGIANHRAVDYQRAIIYLYQPGIHDIIDVEV